MKRLLGVCLALVVLVIAACDPTRLYRESMFRDWPQTGPETLTVPIWEVIPGCPTRECIASLDAESATELTGPQSGVARFAPAREMPYVATLPVAVVEVNGEVRGYPLHIMTRHEIVNDVVGGVPVAVTYCPLCDTALSFDRRMDGQRLDFGVTGFLRNSDLVMFDRQTESWWQQATGEAIAGDFAGDSLEAISTAVIAFSDFTASHSDAMVLTEQTNFAIAYAWNPYQTYDERGGSPFLFNGELDERRDALERVIGLGFGDQSIAVPFDELRGQRSANLAVGSQHVVVLWAPGTASNLDTRDVREGRDIGAGVAFDPRLDGQQLTFEPSGSREFRDVQTGSVWTIAGQAVDGPTEGAQLRVCHTPHTSGSPGRRSTLAPKSGKLSSGRW